MTKDTYRTKFSLLAYFDGAVRNGSFVKVNYRPKAKRGVATWMNGDFMGLQPLSTEEEVEQAREALLKEGRAEYSLDRFRELAPRCCRI